MNRTTCCELPRSLSWHDGCDRSNCITPWPELDRPRAGSLEAAEAAGRHRPAHGRPTRPSAAPDIAAPLIGRRRDRGLWKRPSLISSPTGCNAIDKVLPTSHTAKRPALGETAIALDLKLAAAAPGAPLLSSRRPPYTLHATWLARGRWPLSALTTALRSLRERRDKARRQ
ncbi:hypothetical protein T440DRAFT_536864 [Plenodomus tracheiphilus IPT5]|uniref:Uncharacterized protein n=1 Tax=Plenodomus tracheiphilus IPT5 TaxID=1408161 RepID=A0A6A7B1N1_9PLEO|nr:hypothetical protein T440DRAFT_536864 [Plenodomus tracheiphilus IPT5]